MKKFTTVLVFIFVAFAAQAQDTLILKNGQELKTKVLEILSTEIKYKPFDNLEGAVYQIDKPLVFMVKFANGKKEVIDAAPVQTPVNNQDLVTITPKMVNNNPNSENLCDKGAQDAKVNYKASGGMAGGISGATVLLSPLAGAITAGIIASTPPKISNFNAPTQSLLTNAQYVGCYQSEAHKIKKKAAWMSFGIGSACWLVLLLIL